MRICIFIILSIVLSCSQKSKNIVENIETAYELNSTYFFNEYVSFDLYAKEMKKETKKISLNLHHDMYCINVNLFQRDTIFNSLDSTFLNLNQHLDSIFLNLNKMDLTELCFFSEKFSLDYYDHKGNIKFNLEADTAIQYIDKNFIQLKNNVIFSTPENKKLMTNNLYWDILNKTVWTYDSIVIKNIDTVQARGCGLFSADNFKHYKTYGVEGTYDLLD